MSIFQLKSLHLTPIFPIESDSDWKIHSYIKKTFLQKKAARAMYLVLMNCQPTHRPTDPALLELQAQLNKDIYVSKNSVLLLFVGPNRIIFLWRH